MRLQNLLPLSVAVFALALMTAGAVSIFLVALAGGLFAVLSIRAADRYRMDKDLAAAYVQSARADSYRVYSLNHPALVIDGAGNMQVFAARESLPETRPALDSGSNLEPDAQPALPVLPVLDRALAVLLYGSQGTGKTTLLNHLLDCKLSRGESCLVLDPHGYHGKYPRGCESGGYGRNYAEIESKMKWIINEINRRYQDFRGQEYKKLNILIDELTLLHSNCETFKEFMRVLLTESRKVGIRAIVCCHSTRAEFLGLKGGYDLADGLTICTLKMDRSFRRWAEIDGERFALPGPGRPEPDRPEPETEPGPGPEPAASWFHPWELKQIENKETQEEKIKRMYASGKYLSEIAKEVFGYANGKTVSKIKDILNL